MATAVSSRALGLDSTANTLLQIAARFWFFTAVVGQLMFAFTIVSFYGRTSARGNFLAWNKVLPHGYEAGNAVGNVTLGMHLLFAVAIIIAGAIQLVPQIRTRFPAFHRWTGRMYILIAFIMSITGLYLALSGRNVVGDLSQHVAICINAILIMVCAIMVWRYAMARNFTTHRRWALRLFLVVNGVWFFRVGLMFWLFVNKGPVGFDPESFTGPALTILSFAQYLLPLTILELYLRTRDWAASSRIAFATGLFLLTILMGVGIFAATMGMWLPRIRLA